MGEEGEQQTTVVATTTIQGLKDTPAAASSSSSSSVAIPLARQSSSSSTISSATSNHAATGATGSTARSRPSKSGQQSPSQSKNFEFVLVTDNESRRQVRRHAMRQYMHQRRLDSIARLGASRIPVSGWTTRPVSASDSPKLESPINRVEDVDDGGTTKTERSSPSSDEEQRQQHHRPSTKDRAKEPPRLLLPKSHKIKCEVESPLPLTVRRKYPDPKVFPEQGVIRDPFSTYPVPISQADNELIQHFVDIYPSMMYKFANSYTYNPMMEIFRQFAMHDELPFQAMLAIASKHRAGVEGKTESVQSLTHKMRALRLMNERIQLDSKGQHDGTIYAVATMAVIEKWSKDASIERMHFKGLSSMIRYRGGMQSMRTSSPFLEKVLYWVDFSCARKAIINTALPWTGAVPDSPPTCFPFLNPNIHLPIPHNSTSPENTENLCDQLRAREDFLRFFRHLYELERAALNSPSSIAPANSPPRLKSFIPGTRLHSILTSLPDYDHGIRDIRFIDEYTCMSCLFFLAVALHHCYSTSTNFDHYLNWLEAEVYSINPYENPSITSILWVFLNNGGFPSTDQGDSGDRCWVVSRMMRVAKHLEWKQQGTIWNRLRAVLIDFILSQQECALGSDLVDTEALSARARKRDQAGGYFWNEDEMRNDVMDLDISLPTTLSGIDINVPVLT